MQESYSTVPVVSPEATRPLPQHDDIAQCARELWTECGCPADRDLEIWLQAEQKLLATTTQVSREKKSVAAGSGKRASAKQSHS